MTNTTTFSGTLRLLTGLALLTAAVLAGVYARSPWIILLFGAAYTVSFVAGRWRRWQLAAKAGLLQKALLGIPLTLLIQCFLVGVLYLIGYGVGAMAGSHAGFEPLANLDWQAALCLGIGGAVMGLFIIWLERDRPAGQAEVSSPDIRTEDLALTGEPVTPQSFFDGIHFSHGTYEGEQRQFNDTPNEKSAGSETKITAAEVRLGVVLPEGLKALYRVQNGGSVNQVCIPKDGVTPPLAYEDVIMPFSGYNDLYPTETLRTVHDSITDYADPDDPEFADEFPEGCRNMIVLAQWYQETLFLDYNVPGLPRVGFVNFDTHAEGGWSRVAVWWPDFDTFFAALRHYEDR